MPESDLSNVVIKRDEAGRVRSTAAQRTLLPEAFERSRLIDLASVAQQDAAPASGGRLCGGQLQGPEAAFGDAAAELHIVLTGGASLCVATAAQLIAALI